MEQPFKNHYCPCCLSAVNPRTGDHWDYCEYEAGSVGNYLNQKQPLTEIEMLEEGILRTKEKLKRNRKIERELRSRITVIRARLDTAQSAI